MNIKRLFWKIYFANRSWSYCKMFGWCYVEEMCSDKILYAGITLFGFSILYSDSWNPNTKEKANEQSTRFTK